MKEAARILAIVLISCVGAPLITNAVSWSPFQEEREEKAASGIMEKGAVICLFQSGTADVRKEIHVNDILPVYRENQNLQMKEVGKIRVLTYVGDDYLKGEVVEGEVKAGDIAKKGDVASLVVSEGKTCK